MKHFLFGIALLASLVATAQSVPERLRLAWELFERDSQLRAGIASIYVQDAKTGAVVFERNSRIGLAPASSQKVITAASAYEILGASYRYKTELLGDQRMADGVVDGRFYVLGSGDPSLGSWRWTYTEMDSVLQKLVAAVKAKKIRNYATICVPRGRWDTEIIPPGWIWEDLGQYYGAGADVLNWHENQFDLTLRSGAKVGDSVTISGVLPAIPDSIRPAARAAGAGTGDQTFLYPANNGRPITLRGTIPAGQKSFKVSGSLPDAAGVFAAALNRSFLSNGIVSTSSQQQWEFVPDTLPAKLYPIASLLSPPLDSLVFWFLRKSINLYGEALLKTIAFNKTGVAGTSQGTALLRTFWQEKGVDPAELRLRDGSGLSPENRITTRAQAQVLQYARKQSWFPGFYLALPEYNGMKLKSGTIGGVKAYCGYHTSKAGVTYTVSFIVNNYNGSERAIVQKMFAVLNELK